MTPTGLRTHMTQIIAILLGATTIAFLLGIIAPGDPAVEALRQGPYDEPNPAAVAELRREWGLDESVLVQYGNWMSRMAQGDLGVSYFSRRPVVDELLTRLPATLALAATSITISVVAGVGLGIAVTFQRWPNLGRVVDSSTIAVASVPSFITGVLLIALFAEWLRWLPTSGYGTVEHLILPAVALSLGESARLFRLTRASLDEILRTDFLLTAHAKGLRGRTIAIRHALPNALLNVVTAIGLHLGAILGGAAIIETIFAWPGIGRLAVEAINRRDYPVIQGFVLFSAAILAMINIVVDLAYTRLDPRLREAH